MPVGKRDFNNSIRKNEPRIFIGSGYIPNKKLEERKKINSPKKEIYIDFDNNLVKYTPSNFSNFRLAYAISIHKSQGSEFKVVIMPLVKGYNKMLYKKLVYTGVTRTKETLYLIGEYSSLQLAVKNNIEGLRRTTLKNRLLI